MLRPDVHALTRDQQQCDKVSVKCSTIFFVSMTLWLCMPQVRNSKQQCGHATARRPFESHYSSCPGKELDHDPGGKVLLDLREQADD